jgi:hypothetical protein
VGHAQAIRGHLPDHQWVGTVVDPPEETCMKITVPIVVLSFWLSGVAAAQVIQPDAGETRRVGDRRTFFPAAHGARADLPPPWHRTGPTQWMNTAVHGATDGHDLSWEEVVA